MFSSLIFLPLPKLEGNDKINSPLRSESRTTLTENATGFPSVFNPFPKRSASLIQPLDSLKLPKGIIDFSFGQRKIDVLVSWDWSTITITETIDNRNLKIPLTSSLDWYLKTLQQKSWHVAFLEVMQTSKKDDKRSRRGQMLEVVGVDIGGATTDVFSVFKNYDTGEDIFNRSVSANLGMSYSFSNVLVLINNKW